MCLKNEREQSDLQLAARERRRDPVRAIACRHKVIMRRRNRQQSRLESLLECVLGEVEVTEDADEDREAAPPFLAKDPFDYDCTSAPRMTNDGRAPTANGTPPSRSPIQRFGHGSLIDAIRDAIAQQPADFTFRDVQEAIGCSRTIACWHLAEAAAGAGRTEKQKHSMLRVPVLVWERYAERTFPCITKIRGSFVAGERTGASVRSGTAGSTTRRGSRSAGARAAGWPP